MTLKAAIVGTGEWARIAHLPALRAQSEIEVVSCVGRTAAGSGAFAKEHDIPVSATSVQQALDTTSIDLLCIATPPREHYAACQDGLSAGASVFCEKPITNDAGEAQLLAARASAAGGAHTVGFSFRFDPIVARMRAMLQAGDLGDVWLLEFRQHNSMFHPDTGRERNWKATTEHTPSGALYDFGAHLIDLALWLGGPISDVTSDALCLQPDNPLEDLALAQARFSNGALGSFVASWILDGSYPGIVVHIHGSKASLRAELAQHLPGAGVLTMAGPDGHYRELMTRPTGPVWANVAHHIATWVDAIGGCSKPELPTFSDGAAAQVVLETMLRSRQRWAAVSF